jgi:predicted kinase
MEGTMPKPLLILMCGVPFAGKTTLARAIAVQCGWQYISLDMVNTERGVGMDGQAIPLHEWEQTYAEAYRRVAAALRAGASVIYDETNFLRSQRDQLRAIAATYAVPTCVLYVATPEAEARGRWQQNRISRRRGDVRDDDFAHVVERFEPPAFDEHVILYDPSLPVDTWIQQTFRHGKET